MTRPPNDQPVKSRGIARVRWYRTPLDTQTLASLNTKSNFKGLLQTLRYLGLLTLTGSAALYAASAWPWWTVVLLFFLHGTVASFAINAVHELVHGCVFETQWLNGLFVRIFSLISWVNFEQFYSSHMRHHQFTLHPPDDLEVVLPIRLTVKHFFQTGFVNVKGSFETLKTTLRHSRGRFVGQWETALFPADQPDRGRPVIRWARIHLAVHGIVLVISFYYGWWLLPVLTTLAPFYGSWLFFLCNNTQHIGLQDNVPDFRLCCRTFTLNPVVQFLYWHMNYHIEHHMYAAVPCYNLAKLRRTILHDMPPAPRGIVATWREIAAIQRKQVEDPGYQHVAPLPG
ncbi:MAG: fatty acid desaturase [Ignavibacteriales bacterium]|nr:fatty acid desaturase [Ignavibacteriales bacterium]